MDSDESQDVSSGNESDAASRHSSRSASPAHVAKQRSSSRESAASAPSGSRSRSRSFDRASRASAKSAQSLDSNPQSPENLSEKPDTPTSPQSEGEGEYYNSRQRSAPLSPDNENGSVVSAASSLSNSPVQNNHRVSPGDSANDDSRSASRNSRRSRSPAKLSEASGRSSASRKSRDAHQAANLDDGNTSDSSLSSGGSSGRKNVMNKIDTQPEEISDGDIESDHERNKEKEDTTKPKESGNINITHEDLSDVSDLEDSIDNSDYEASKPPSEHCEERSEMENKAKKTSRSEDGEEQLDFEAEDGECAEPEVVKDDGKADKKETEAGEVDDDKKNEKAEELEEGELTDEDEARPEETEPRPVCRFFSRGQCTWGASCRFLHPGVTDKGNYTMFDLVRPVVPGDYGSDRHAYAGRVDPPPVESAWERGLRTAKEMMRKSIKRKEQDIDFEEKKMNLSLAQEEFDKENGYYAKAPSPEPRYMSVRHATAPVDYPAVRIPPEEYYQRRQVYYEPEYAPIPRDRYRTFREAVPPHRPPEYYNTAKHDEEPAIAKRPKREVIVQRAEERAGRGDEWSDPWMRLKSPAGRKSGRRRSYSSGSSYSSSSTSRSSSASSRSSYRSRSRSSHKKRSPRSGHRRQVSPSVIVSERKAANERAALMNPPAPRKKAPSPGMMRVGAQNPPPPPKVDQFGRTRTKQLAVAAALARVKGRARSSRSSSGSSSGSSSSDSDSSGSSSSSSRNGSPSPRRPTGVDLAMALKAKAIDALKSGTEKRQIKLNLKNSVGAKKPDFAEIARKAEATQNRKRLASSPPAADPKSAANKKASSRREELLKQLKAVEDAIAKKRSKV